MGMAAADIEPHSSALRSAYNNQASEEELEHLALETLFALSGHLPEATVDPRIAQATAFMATRLADPLTLEDVARHVGLSPGRFRHLFVAETGIAFRSHLLWTRLNRALELGFSGMPWTEVAHATNFADSAHLSRTARRMYGIAPSSFRFTRPDDSRQMTA
jgi:transcriptional regulator GlxA family with amidase domain